MSEQTRDLASETRLVPVEMIERRIFLIRDHKVMFDRDLAGLYGVTTSNLNKAVKRNVDRFPPDFMFQLNKDEADALRFQIGTLKTGRGRHRKYLPYAFTEQGVAMLSSVLRSKRAVQVNILIMRAFVRLREALASNKELAEQINAVRVQTNKNTAAIIYIVKEIKRLKTPRRTKSRPIGFIDRSEEDKT